jgi:tRNA A37 threonylcarbamoyladenosine synthetase subunit TsaC/SUA5/YrdC
MFEVKKMSPTVTGVTEAANLMGKGEVVIIPTETIYMACTSIISQHDQEASTQTLRKCKSSGGKSSRDPAQK